jgi:hypothetical protein
VIVQDFTLGPMVDVGDVIPFAFDRIKAASTYVVRLRWCIHTGHLNAIMQTTGDFISSTYGVQNIEIGCEDDAAAVAAFERLMAWLKESTMFIVRSATLSTKPDEVGRTKELANIGSVF